jgi:hypothetical protein
MIQDKLGQFSAGVSVLEMDICLLLEACIAWARVCSLSGEFLFILQRAFLQGQKEGFAVPWIGLIKQRALQMVVKERIVANA